MQIFNFYFKKKQSRSRNFAINAKVTASFYFLSVLVSFFSRGVFLNSLGSEFIGLIGTLGNFLGLLNLAELGVSSAISYMLYSALNRNNKQEISETISVLAYLYKRIGIVIGVAAIFFSLFFPLFFRNSGVSLSLVYVCFFVFLSSSLFSYFVNYKQILLVTDQKNYMVVFFVQGTTLLKQVFQCLLLMYNWGIYSWLILEFVTPIIQSILFSRYIKHLYPDITPDSSKGKEYLKSYPTIKQNIKNIFAHKFAGVILTQTDQIVIYLISNLSQVAFYGNYLLVINKIGDFFAKSFNSTFASVGDLIAEGDMNKSIRIFWELVYIRHFIAGFIIFALYETVEPFIILWLGDKYILSHAILLLALGNSFIYQIRGTFDNYLHSFGLFSDVWAPWTEAIVNLVLSLWLGYYIGIEGVLIGTFISTFLIICVWKPFYLFKSGFHLKYLDFLVPQLKVLFLNIISFIVASLIINEASFEIQDCNKYIHFGLNTVVVCLVYIPCSLLIFYLLSDNFRSILRTRVLKRMS